MKKGWAKVTIGEVLPFKYGKNLPVNKRTQSGEYLVITSAGASGTHNIPVTNGPSIVIGRKGTIGSLLYAQEPIWPTDTVFYTLGTTSCDLQFGYYLLRTMPLGEMNHDSAVPGLNRNAAESLEVLLPPLVVQKNIAAVLSSFDDKIRGNNKIIKTALKLQKTIWMKATAGSSLTNLVEIAEPILGGTPKRSEDSFWSGSILWASVKDMSASPFSHLTTTAESITEKAAIIRRFSPLPAGSILISARGTVGRVVSLVKPAAFNQSAYGFISPQGQEAAMRLAIEDAVEELRSKSYGSVFSTITKQLINECKVPNVFTDRFARLHNTLGVFEERIIAAELENQTLAQTRDELLPLLMSGKISIAEAAEAAEEVGVGDV